MTPNEPTRITSFLLLPLCVLLACDDAQSEPKEPAAAPAEAAPALGPGETFALGRLEEKLEKVKAALASGDDVNAAWCGAMTAHQKSLEQVADEAVKAKIAEATRLCEHDVPIAEATKAVVAAEEARAKAPDKNPLSECFSGPLTTAFKTLEEKQPDDAEFRSLQKRFDTVCPKRT